MEKEQKRGQTKKGYSWYVYSKHVNLREVPCNEPSKHTSSAERWKWDLFSTRYSFTRFTNSLIRLLSVQVQRLVFIFTEKYSLNLVLTQTSNSLQAHNGRNDQKNHTERNGLFHINIPRRERRWRAIHWISTRTQDWYRSLQSSVLFIER